MRHREPCQAGDRAALSGSSCVPQQACTSMFRNFFQNGTVIMKKLGKSIRKLLNSFRSTVVFGTFLSTVCFYVIAVIMALTGVPEIMYIVGIMFLINLVYVGVPMFIMMLCKPHKYDAEIIGDNFIGIGKKNSIFSSSVKELLTGRADQALNGFKLLEEDFSDKLEPSEKAVLNFYIARCYDVMDYLPNALKYYGEAERLGFDHDILPFMCARCTGSMGDTDEAIGIYKKIIENNNNDYRMFVRTDIGKMFLHLNDAENALKWFGEAAELHENYAEALGGAAVAHTMLHHFEQGEVLYRAALLNNINNPDSYTDYYKRVQAAVLTECHTKECFSETEN